MNVIVVTHTGHMVKLPIVIKSVKTPQKYVVDQNQIQFIRQVRKYFFTLFDSNIPRKQPSINIGKQYEYSVSDVPIGYEQVGDNMLKLACEAGTWYDARKSCSSQGGIIATITSTETNNWVSKQL